MNKDIQKLRAVPGLTRDLFETAQEVPGQVRDSSELE